MTQTPEELIDSPDPARGRDVERGRESAPVDLWGSLLSKIRLSGAIFLLGEYTQPWAYESPPAEALAAFLRPGARRLVLFHLVAEGRCWIRLDGGEYLEASEGELVVLPSGDQHVMGDTEGERPVPIGSLVPPLPWAQLPVIRHGGGGERTSVVCGYLYGDDPLFDRLTRALPRLFSVRPPDGPAAAWMRASIQYAYDASREAATGTAGAAGAGGPATALAMATVRLPELLFGEALRLYLEREPPSAGWLGGMGDPIVGRALVELHADPARKWTAEELARRASCSRSTLNERFRRLVGRSPMGYLGEWRLQLAAELLRETSLGVGAVAARVGYESEEAFNRAFKRAMGRPPARWRQGAAVPAGAGGDGGNDGG